MSFHLLLGFVLFFYRETCGLKHLNKEKPIPSIHYNRQGQLFDSVTAQQRIMHPCTLMLIFHRELNGCPNSAKNLLMGLELVVYILVLSS